MAEARHVIRLIAALLPAWFGPPTERTMAGNAPFEGVFPANGSD